MRIILIGGTGTIGSAVAAELAPRHEILIASSSKGGMLKCDITSEESLNKMFKKAGKFDAVVVTAGAVHFEELSKMSPEKLQIGLQSKLMGQVNAVLIGSKYIQDQGSFTLTSGILSHDPIRSGSSASMVNSAIDGFVRGAAIELLRGMRINAVSPTVVSESMAVYAPYFRGFEPVPAATVALAYSKSVEGHQTGQIYCVWN